MANSQSKIKKIYPVLFVGAGPGDPELITVKGQKALIDADVIVYAGSLVPEAVLKWANKNVKKYNSAVLDLDKIIEIIKEAHCDGKKVVRLHTGDPSLYGALFEQMMKLKECDIEYQIIPGVTAAFAAAASLKIEYTIPKITQTLILTRVSGRTPVPEIEKLESLVKHKSSIVIYLSISLVDKIAQILANSYGKDAMCAVACKVSHPDEKIFKMKIKDLAKKVKDLGIKKHALIITGKAIDVENVCTSYNSKLYDKNFSHEYRQQEK